MLTKTEILNAIEKNMRLVMEEFDTFDPSLSMLDHGANSLELVEIVSRTLRELSVRVPRVRLNRVTNIDELADEIVRAANKVEGETAHE